MVAMMDFGLPNGLALISSPIVISEGRICVHLWFKLPRLSAASAGEKVWLLIFWKFFASGIALAADKT
jgi:hypothetical protein